MLADVLLDDPIVNWLLTISCLLHILMLIFGISALDLIYIIEIQLFAF